MSGIGEEVVIHEQTVALASCGLVVITSGIQALILHTRLLILQDDAQQGVQRVGGCKEA